MSEPTPDQETERPTSLGIYDKPSRTRGDRDRDRAIVLSA